MKVVTKKNLTEILQAIYDSEINLVIGWLWDGGFDYMIHNAPTSIPSGEEILSTNERDLVKALNVIVKDVLKKYPKSTFAKKYSKEPKDFNKEFDKKFYVSEGVGVQSGVQSWGSQAPSPDEIKEFVREFINKNK